MTIENTPSRRRKKSLLVNDKIEKVQTPRIIVSRKDAMVVTTHISQHTCTTTTSKYYVDFFPRNFFYWPQFKMQLGIRSTKFACDCKSWSIGKVSSNNYSAVSIKLLKMMITSSAWGMIVDALA